MKSLQATELQTSLLQATDESEALEALHELGCTDGLPVVVPTPERVERMVLASGLSADIDLGAVGPLGGAATVDKVATAAVMAGCLPDFMPVVVAAIQAIITDEFDSTEVQGTTHCLSPVLIVNGPARHSCGPIASGYGCLGTGHRANLSIGRAVRLVMRNVGGAIPGVSDMALHGQPGKLAMCFAENEEDSPFTPLHVSRGFAADQSVVTIAATESPQSVIFSQEADQPDRAKNLLRILGKSLARVGANNAHLGAGTGVVVLNPDHANLLAEAGLSREDVAEGIHAEAHNLAKDLTDVGSFVARSSKASPDDLLRAFQKPEDILVVVAGGLGIYSMVMTSWGAGPSRNPAISVEINIDQACAVPWATS